LEEAGFDFEIFGRPKSVHSILNKIKTKHVAFEEVYDLFAVRIILKTDNEKADCWNAFSIITSKYQHSLERLRDWVSTPKSNGYEALHTTVMGPEGKWVEVQIRTERMNEIAEKGLAAHWKYKDGTSQESKLDDWLKHIKELLQNPDNNAMDFIQDLKLDIFTEEIYTYTPNGDMRVLPLGASALDFAFDIHSELGKNCIGAKVNYKLVPINHVLKNADQIEIITSKKQKPNDDWLKFVVTAKAKSRIKYYLKEEKRIIAEDGKATFLRKIEHLNIPNVNAHFSEIANFYKFTSPLDLFYAIAKSTFDVKEFSKLKFGNEKIIFPEEIKKSYYEQFFKSLKELDTEGVEIIPQTMAPFPWHFGGQRYQNIFVHVDEIVKYCEDFGIRMCFDVSHTMLTCNHFKQDFYEFATKIAPYTAHIHMGDAKGVNGEGLQIGSGDIDFQRLGAIMQKNCPNASFIPEIWQGHKNQGEGFWIALDRLTAHL
jgi:GTP pyrophosphokinase